MDSFLGGENGISLAKAIDALLLSTYNTRVVILGATLLGIASGTIGTFMLLRKRSLVSDAVSHAALPGIGVAFIVMQLAFGDGKYFPGLLLGALVAGLVGMGAILAIRNMTRLQEDAAIGIVLSVFFGLGVALLGIIQKMRTGQAAGLEGFIYGKTASMIASDALLIGGISGVILLAVLLFHKEFSLVCFDQGFARAEGYPILAIDTAMLGLAVLLTVVGLQAVGLILMIALLIIPAAAARFWTHRLSWMIVLAALIGGLSAYLGAAVSATAPNLPAGAIIVVTAGLFLVASVVLGTDRGLLTEAGRFAKYGVRLSLHRLLVAASYDIGLAALHRVQAGIESTGVELDGATLRKRGAWNRVQLRASLYIALRAGLLRRLAPDLYELTPRGVSMALRSAQNHELQHLYLREYPETAQALHQRDEENIEDYIEPDVADRLRSRLSQSKPHLFNAAVDELIARVAGNRTSKRREARA